MTTQPCKFLTSAAEPMLEFASVAELAAHVHALRGGRPIILKPATVSLGQHGMPGLSVRWAEDEGASALGYAFVGDPPLRQSVQFELLGAALAALAPQRVAA